MTSLIDRGIAAGALRGVTIALLALPLGGCVLDRVLETHRQLCDVRPPQVVVAASGAGYRVDFTRPTLTNDDILWLVGLPPTRVVDAPDGPRLVYVAAPLDPALPRAGTLSTELVFRDTGGAPKLAATIPPERVASLVPREIVDAVVATICHPELSFAPPGARFDLAQVPPAAYPDEARIMAQLGPPHFRDGTNFGYRFCLEPCDPAARPIATFVYATGDDGSLRRATLAYFRYQLDIDRAARTATLALRLP